METTDKSVGVLKDLIQINNDRVAGFEKAAADLKGGDADLQAVFDKLAGDSESNAIELSQLVTQAGDSANTGTSVSGAIHRAWIDVKATFTGHDRKSVLQECERGEDAIKKAYQTALSSDSGLSGEALTIVTRQKATIDAGHNQIKALRDSQA